jgi:hypothetical protein
MLMAKCLGKWQRKTEKKVAVIKTDPREMG